LQASRIGTSAALAAAATAGLLLASCGGGGGGGGETATTAVAPPVNALPAGKRVARLDKVAAVRQPTSVVQPPGNRNLLFVTTKPGQVLVLKNGKLRRDEPFLDLTDEVNSEGSEQGMFSIAFAPDYAKSRRFYVSYNMPDNSVQVDEFKRSADNSVFADPDSRRAIINAPHGKGEREQHNGGELQFGPDGDLYIGFGDGGPVVKPFVSNRAQQRSVLLGKIVRIDPLHPSGSLPYMIPKDNPFIGRPGERPEIYAYGLRNPWRFSFDTRTGALVIGDAGAAKTEEIDYEPQGQARGKNFGWPRFEGDKPFRTDYELNLNDDQPPVKPIHTYSHDLGCSVIGGYVIHDPRIPKLDGNYIYGDACSGDLRVFVPTGDGAKGDHSLGLRLSPTKVFGLVSFGRGDDGKIYGASFSGGVYVLNPQPKKK
jgi:glucose/arabinose dehydrogenase